MYLIMGSSSSNQRGNIQHRVQGQELRMCMLAPRARVVKSMTLVQIVESNIHID